MAAGFDREELRALVRQALKESLGNAGAPQMPSRDGLAGEIRAALARGKPARVTVNVGTDADLDRFAKGIAIASEDAALKSAIVAGDVRFVRAHAAPGASAATKPAGERSGTFQFASGILGEAKIVEISRNHRKIVIAEEVVLTPLARDKAREMKVEIVRQKP